MSASGDCGDEMFRFSHLDDDTTDRILDGRTVADQGMLESFVTDIRAVSSAPAPQPGAELVSLFVGGSPADADEVPAAAAVTAGTPPVANPPEKEKASMFETTRSRVAAMGVAAKVSLAAGAVAFAGTAAAATGTLPDAAQDRVADSVGHLGITIPGGSVGDAGAAGDASSAEEAEFGDGVSGDARDGAPQEDGAQFGQDVSDDARETYQPETPAGDESTGDDARETYQPEAPAGAPRR